MHLGKALAAALLALAVAGCETSPYGPKQTIGGLTGGALGGLLGSQFGAGQGRLIATGAGVLIGALIGSELGRGLDDNDRSFANRAVVRSHDGPLGEPINWRNPDSGNYGSITPMRDGTTASGLYCREFRQTITVGGERADGYGTACRQPDGTWRIVG